MNDQTPLKKIVGSCGFPQIPFCSRLVKRKGLARQPKNGSSFTVVCQLYGQMSRIVGVNQRQASLLDINPCVFGSKNDVSDLVRMKTRFSASTGQGRRTAAKNGEKNISTKWIVEPLKNLIDALEKYT